LVAFAELAFTPSIPGSRRRRGPGPGRDRARPDDRPLLRAGQGDGDRRRAEPVRARRGPDLRLSPVIDADGASSASRAWSISWRGPASTSEAITRPATGRSSSTRRQPGGSAWPSATTAISRIHEGPAAGRGRARGRPQAGAVGEWTEGIFEAELQVAAFQNGITPPWSTGSKGGRTRLRRRVVRGRPRRPVVARAPRGRDHVLIADCDFGKNAASHAAATSSRTGGRMSTREWGLADGRRKAALMLRWYVINTKPKKESQVERLFIEGGFTVYCRSTCARGASALLSGLRLPALRVPRAVPRWSNTPAASSAWSATTTARRPSRTRSSRASGTASGTARRLREIRPGAGRRRRDRVVEGRSRASGHLPQGGRDSERVMILLNYVSYQGMLLIEKSKLKKA